MEDTNLVALWLKVDPKRWIAGALGGVFAGLISMIFAMALSKSLGAELWFPTKVPALPFVGNIATELGFNHYILLGLIIHEVLCIFLGIAYAHFSVVNKLSTLFGVGLVWGLFSWIFIQMLFAPSFKFTFAVAQIPPGAGLAFTLVFGLSLPSVAFFDKALHN